MLAEAVGRSAGGDVQAFLQRELLDKLGIPADSWHWERDRVGHVQGFYGVNMRPDDFGRLGELLRRGGIWRGRRAALAPLHARGARPLQDERLLRAT